MVIAQNEEKLVLCLKKYLERECDIITKKKKKSNRYNPHTYQVYGATPIGNHLLNLAMANDNGLYQFVKRNNKRLAKMSKGSAIKSIKANATENWSKQDLRKVNLTNVRSKDLKWYLRNFNE